MILDDVLYTEMHILGLTIIWPHRDIDHHTPNASCVRVRCRILEAQYDAVDYHCLGQTFHF